MLPKTPETEALWQAFREHASPGEKADYVVVAPGRQDSPALADELSALIVAGTKRATASLARDYGEETEPLPAVGDYVVVCDGALTPKCIWRTTEIEVKPLSAVDEKSAWDEGEGDRTRRQWLKAHTAYFTGQAGREGFEMHDEMMTVFERVEVVWPAEIADRARKGP